MTPAPSSASRRAGDDVLAPTATSLRMRAVDGAASPAGAAPGVADPPQTVARELGGVVAEFHGTHRDMMARTLVRQDDGGWYVSCSCGYTTGYCESNAQASRIAALHSREAHAG